VECGGSIRKHSVPKFELDISLPRKSVEAQTTGVVLNFMKHQYLLCVQVSGVQAQKTCSRSCSSV